MLKQSSESRFNSLTAPAVISSATGRQYSPGDSRGQFTLAVTEPTRKVIRGRTGLTWSQTPAAKTSHSSHKLGSCLETGTFKRSLFRKVLSAATPTFGFKWYWAKATMKYCTVHSFQKPHRGLYPLGAEKWKAHCSRLACLAILVQD